MAVAFSPIIIPGIAPDFTILDHDADRWFDARCRGDIRGTFNAFALGHALLTLFAGGLAGFLPCLNCYCTLRLRLR